ncbi:MAG: ComEC/Rec2 family competence protein [Bauldia sp.]|nr:ComEC/Rec2 family competence protein [Bauldia sp.]
MAQRDIAVAGDAAERAGAPWRGRRLFAAAVAAAGRSFEREMEQRRGALWIPVLLGGGILLYFGLPAEPPLALVAALTILAGAAVRIALRRSRLVWLAVVVLCAAGGLALGKVRTEIVATPFITTQYTGVLTGWIERVERMGPREVRIVVRVASLEDFSVSEQPEKVRITVRGDVTGLIVGAGISGLVGLQPPAAPVIPGGYDFGRELFYRGIGGSGFSYGPPDLADIGPLPFGIAWRVPVERLRDAIGAKIEATLPGDVGQIANALVTGDRGGPSDQITEAYRVSGLTHILSISGLHMALVAAISFSGLRAILALFPPLALRRPIKKWAAGGALGLSGFYLLISGGDIAAQRSFIMLAVMLVAVMLDRRAFSVRNIAIAALIVLVLTPEAILTAGFQMSFAATLALVAGFEALAARRRERLAIGPAPGWSPLRYAGAWIAGTLLTSLLAGLATAPFGAFHFNRTQPLSLVANLLAIPFVSFVVMAMLLVAVLLMAFGWADPFLAVAGWGIEQVNAIATLVAGWTGTSGMVAASPPIALVLAVAGLFWLCLWRERWRLLGLAPIAIAVLLAGSAARPDILIDETGTAMMVRGPDGLFRFVGRGASFEQEVWLRADADARLPGDPTLRDGVFCDPVGCTAPLGSTGGRVALATGPSALMEDCGVAIVVVTGLDAPPDCAAMVVGRGDLVRLGVHAVFIDQTEGGGRAFRLTTARPEVRRPWMPPLPPEFVDVDGAAA